MNVLRASAAHTHEDAERAVGEAAKSLQAPLDAKLREIADIRAQVKAQTKQLEALVDACNAKAKVLSDAAGLARDRPTVVQGKVEVLHRRTRVLEEVSRR